MLWKLSFEFYALWFALLNTTVTKHKCLQKEICNARVVLRSQCISVIKLTFYELVNRMCGLLWYFVVQLQCKYTLQWRHNGCDGVSNHQPHVCLLNRLFRCRSKKTSKLRFTGLCVGNSPVNSPHKWPVTRKMFPFEDHFDEISIAGCTRSRILANSTTANDEISLKLHFCFIEDNHGVISRWSSIWLR